jgi:TonB family protein
MESRKLDRWRRLQELFEAAADLDPGKQAAYLASACAGEDELRQEVEALLRSDAEAGSFIEQAIWRGSDLLLAAEPDPLESLGKIGKYEILGRIGEGGFGVVYKGRDPVLQRWVAVKTCSSSDEKLRRRFFREGQIAAGLQHPNITTVHDLGVERGIPYLVQEFLDGEDLHHKIAREEGLTPLRRLDVLAQVARGLEYAHQQGVLHRDVKPANIRILPSGAVKIMDFGIAKLLHEVSDVTTQGLTLGTVGYLAPEQLRGEEVDRRTDIFSFGVLVHELLTFERPFRGSTFSEVSYRLLNEEPVALRDLAPAYSRAIAALASRCLAKDPGQRYESFEQILAVLEPEIEALRSGAFQVPAGAAAAARMAAAAESGGVAAGRTAARGEGEGAVGEGRSAAAGKGGGAAGEGRSPAAGKGGRAAGEVRSAAAGEGGGAVGEERSAAAGEAATAAAARIPAAAQPAGAARRRLRWAIAGWLAAAVAVAAAAGLGGRMTSRRLPSEAPRAAAGPAVGGAPPATTPEERAAESAASNGTEPRSAGAANAPSGGMKPGSAGAGAKPPEEAPRSSAIVGTSQKAPAAVAAGRRAGAGPGEGATGAKARQAAAGAGSTARPETLGPSATARQAAAGREGAATPAEARQAVRGSQERRRPPAAASGWQEPGGLPDGRSSAGVPPAATAAAGSGAAVEPRGDAGDLTGTAEAGSRTARSAAGQPQSPAGGGAPGAGAGEPGGASRPMARGDLIPPGAPGATPPRLLSRPEPQYPERARRRQAEADVLLLALVDENGRVVRTIVKRTDDPGLGFNEAAKQAALRTTFDPATRDGLPGKMWTELPFSFRLHPG